MLPVQDTDVVAEEEIEEDGDKVNVGVLLLDFEFVFEYVAVSVL